MTCLSNLEWLHCSRKDEEEHCGTSVDKLALVCERNCWGAREPSTVVDSKLSCRQIAVHTGNFFNTEEPRGAIERAGRTLGEKQRFLRIDAKLPENLWPETWATVAYLANRTPNRSLGWKSPWQLLNEWLERTPTKPLIGHLRRCTYILDYNHSGRWWVKDTVGLRRIYRTRSNTVAFVITRAAW